MKQTIYIAGPMRGVPEFNFPLFNSVTLALRKAGHDVFNPAERDNERHGTDISAGNLEGCEAKAAADHGFNLREALREDTAWICDHATTIVMLPDSEFSKGATVEYCLAVALGIHVVEMADPDDDVVTLVSARKTSEPGGTLKPG